MRLQTDVRERQHATTELQLQNRVRRRHQIERPIAELELLPKNKGRAQMLRRLRKQLTELNDV